MLRQVMTPTREHKNLVYTCWAFEQGRYDILVCCFCACFCIGGVIRLQIMR